MTSEQYRPYLTESIKIGAQMMHDMAEDIAGQSDFITNLAVTISFDPEQSKHGFDRDQIVEFLENMGYVADAVQDGRLNMTDINNANRQEIHLNTTADIYQKSIGSRHRPITFYGPLVFSDSEHPCNIPLE